MALTDTAIRAAKPKDRLYKLADRGGLYGLPLVHHGARLWRLKYRLGGREKILSIGAYPAVSLALAREKREEAKILLAQGSDPSQAKQDAKRKLREATSNSFRVIAEEFLDKLRREERAPTTLSKIEWMLGLVYGEIGEKPIREITASHILDALRTIERRGRHETARRTRSTIGSVFRYAVATTRADHDPTFALRGALTAPKVNHRSAIIDPIKFGALLRAIKSCERAADYKSSAATHVDPFSPSGRIADGRMVRIRSSKGNLDHPPQTHKDAPSPSRATSEISLGYSERAASIDRQGHSRFSWGAHADAADFGKYVERRLVRRLGHRKTKPLPTASAPPHQTLLNELGKWNPDAIERQLAHVENNDVRRAYTRGEHWEERVKMMEYWADLVRQLQEGGTVISFQNTEM